MDHRHALNVCLFAVALAALPAAALAQMPPDIAEKIKAIGRVIDVPKSYALYTPLHETEPYAGVKVTRDIKYGPDARNALDIFVPESPSTGPRPVFIFVHGGGFVAGNKRTPGTPFYDNFMLFAAKNGMIGVNVTYRLAPANPWPAAPQDLAAAMKWVVQNIASYSGDPARIFLTGSSAGAAIVASFVADPKLHPAADNLGVKGLLLLAGVYDFTGFTDPSTKAYLGDDPTKYTERSPLIGLMNNKVPMFLAWAELDPPFIVKQSEILYANLCNKNRCPKKIWLPNHSHMSTVLAVNTKDTQLADAMLDFIRSVK
jgi:triacylglycerol lipase